MSNTVSKRKRINKRAFHGYIPGSYADALSKIENGKRYIMPNGDICTAATRAHCESSGLGFCLDDKMAIELFNEGYPGLPAPDVGWKKKAIIQFSAAKRVPVGSVVSYYVDTDGLVYVRAVTGDVIFFVGDCLMNVTELDIDDFVALISDYGDDEPGNVCNEAGAIEIPSYTVADVIEYDEETLESWIDGCDFSWGFEK